MRILVKKRAEGQKPAVHGDLCWLITQSKGMRKYTGRKERQYEFREADMLHRKRGEHIVRSTSTRARNFLPHGVSFLLQTNHLRNEWLKTISTLT